MTQVFTAKRALLATALLAMASLSACATTGDSAANTKAPDPITPSEQYALTAQSQVDSINLRINATGLSANQARALDQVASRAAWTSDSHADIQIVTSGDPRAMAAGRSVAGYLTGRDVPGDAVSQFSQADQPADIITVNIVDYQARTYACNQSWENLAATRNNKTYANFGCAVTSNLAAQVADPRDLIDPAAATSTDAGRKSVVLDKYRKGEVTSAAKDDQSTGTISQAIK